MAQHDPQFWPTSRYVEWAPSELFQVRKGGQPRRFSALVLSLLSRMAYAAPDLSLPFLQEVFPGVTARYFADVGSPPIGWTEYTIPEGILCALHGIYSLYDLINLAWGQPELTTINGQQVWILSSVWSYLEGYYQAMKSRYAAQLQSGAIEFLFTGHSMGGLAANWCAWRFNTEYPPSTGNRGRVPVVYSFGSPAGWRMVSEEPWFNERHVHKALISSGDPIPGIAQVYVATTGSLQARGQEIQQRIPRVYEDYQAILGQPATRLDQLANWSQQMVQTRQYVDAFTGPLFPSNVNFRGPQVELAYTLAYCHSMLNYTNQLLTLAQQSQDMPIDEFTTTHQWFLSLGQQGL